MRKVSHHLIRKAIILVLLFVAAAYLILPRLQADDRLVTVHFQNPNNSNTPSFQLELAATSQARSLGLMYRKSLEEDRGMLFVFPEKAIQSFWMKNTFVALDMLFLDERRTVVGVLANVPTSNEQRRSVQAESLYVIEFRGGTAAKHGIVVGSQAVFDKDLPMALD